MDKDRKGEVTAAQLGELLEKVDVEIPDLTERAAAGVIARIDKVGLAVGCCCLALCLRLLVAAACWCCCKS